MKCFVPGCDQPAPYGLRWPGFRSDTPANRKGTLHHCKEHQADAEARRDAAMGKKKVERKVA